jgi:hypothetical protein
VLFAAAILLLGLGAVTTAAQAPAEYRMVVHLVPDTSQAGVVTLSFFGALGTPVTFYERVGEQIEKIATKTTPTGVPTILPHAVEWRCERLVRTFVAKTTAPDGRPGRASYDLRTPSCRTRFSLEVPRRVARGKVARVRVVDRCRT